MNGPRDFIRKAARQRAVVAGRTSERIPAPAPVHLPDTPQESMPPVGHRMTQESAGSSASPVSNWRTPPLTPEKSKTVGRDMPAQPSEAQPPVPSGGHYRIVPQNIGGHAIYRDLMRSHDRMNTRHIPPKG